MFVQPANGLKIGFEVMVTDDDDTPTTYDGATARDGHICWANESGNDIAYLNTELYGEATFTGQVSVNDFFGNNRVKIYPTLVHSTLNVSGLQNITKLEIYNVVGERVFNKFVADESTTINMSKFSGGIYFISLSDKNGTTFTRKIVKQ